MTVQASLKNFSIWIPLQADRLDSQILNLSFMSDLNYHMKKAYEVSTGDCVTSSGLTFNINQFVISVINF